MVTALRSVSCALFHLHWSRTHWPIGFLVEIFAVVFGVIARDKPYMHVCSFAAPARHWRWARWWWMRMALQFVMKWEGRRIHGLSQFDCFITLRVTDGFSGNYRSVNSDKRSYCKSAGSVSQPGISACDPIIVKAHYHTFVSKIAHICCLLEAVNGRWCKFI